MNEQQPFYHQVRIVGIPMDLGQQRRGVDMGPSALRYAGLYEHLEAIGCRVNDTGNIPVPVREEHSVRLNVQQRPNDARLRHLPQILDACQTIYGVAKMSVESGEFPIFVGGDHSISIGTIGGLAAVAPIGLIWVDAHGDFNTAETTPSGNIHGMSLAALTGRGSPELVNMGHEGAKLGVQQVVMIGVRDLDREERVNLAESGITVYTMRDVDELGIATVARRALNRLNHLALLHVSFDMDSIDPSFAPGVGTPVPGGLTFREAHLLMEILGESGKVQSLDLVEINPILDTRNYTAELAVELIESILGRRIL